MGGKAFFGRALMYKLACEKLALELSVSARAFGVCERDFHLSHLFLLVCSLLCLW